MNQLNFSEPIILGITLFVFVALLTIPVAATVTFALIHVFRKRVRQSMQETAGIAETPTRQKPPPIPVSTLQELQINHIVATRELARTARSLPLVATVRQQIRQLAAIYMGPACAHPLILAAALTAITYTPNNSKFTGYGNLSMTSNANSTTYDLYRDVTGKFRDLPLKSVRH